jgi:capsular polysaccharide transport system permease protein
MSEKQLNEKPVDSQPSGPEADDKGTGAIPDRQGAAGMGETEKLEGERDDAGRQDSGPESPVVVVLGQKERPVPPRPPSRGPLPVPPKRPAVPIGQGSHPPATIPGKPGVPAQPRPAPLEAWPALVGYDDALRKMRAGRQRRFFARLALMVGLPTLFVLLYLFLWATPRYISEFEVTYQTYQNPQSLSTGLVQSLLGSSQGSVDFGSILYEYIRSATLLEKLDKQLGLRQYYSSHAIDYPARLSADASDERFLTYYHQHVVDVSEGLGGYLTVDVQAFDPDYAQKLAKAIVDSCDEMVDQMTARARLDSIKFAEEEVARQEERIRRAQVAETRFQNEHRDLNPTNTATQYGQIVGNLETELAQTRTALANTLSYASPNAPQVQSLNNQIAALESQLKEQRDRLTGGDKTYSALLEEYSRLQLEEQFAQNAYQSAQQGLVVARADAARKQSYLVDFVTPSHPDRPARSFYIVYVASAFFGAIFLYAVGSLITGAFRDQAGF